MCNNTGSNSTSHSICVQPAKTEDKDPKPVAKEQESVGGVLDGDERAAAGVEEDDLGSMSDYELGGQNSTL